MLEHIVEEALQIDYGVLDELNSEECDQALPFKSYLNSLEMIAHQWSLIKKERYKYRVVTHGQLEEYINEIPRVSKEGKIFNIKTFALSCKTPYMQTKEGVKVFISKEYSNAAGKLHLSFYTLHDTIIRELREKLESIRYANN
jgi:hypothetical protein